MTKTIAKIGLAAVLAASASVAALPTIASAQSRDGVFSCSTPGQKQEGGALLGALIGGLIGSQVNDNERGGGALIGAGVGAAAGSYIGCKAQKSNAYTQDTYVTGGQRLAHWVQPARFERAGGRFVATTRVNLRAAPTTGSAPVGALTRGETFQALAYVKRGEWVLVGRNGVGIGYVHGAYVRPTGYNRTSW